MDALNQQEEKVHGLKSNTSKSSLGCGVGIAWASIVSIPYALIARDIPAKQMGIFMGLFNMFIVLPEIIAALGFGWVMNTMLNNNKLHAVMLGGVLIIIAAFLTLRLQSKETN